MSRAKEELGHCQGRVPDELEFVGRTTQALQDLQSTVRDQEDMIAILVQDVEAFHCLCAPHLPVVSEEATDKEEPKEGPRGLSLEAVRGVVLGSHFASDEEEESLVVATLVEDDGEGRGGDRSGLPQMDGGGGGDSSNHEVGIASDARSMEGAYEDYLERMAEDAHLERMREDPSPIYSLDLSCCPTPNYELFPDLFLV